MKSKVAETPHVGDMEDTPLQVALALGSARAAIREALWDRGFPYEEFRDFKVKLQEMKVAPHVEIAQMAFRYLGRLDINNTEHALAIKALGHATALAGQLASMYDPSGDESDDSDRDGDAGSNVH